MRFAAAVHHASGGRMNEPDRLVGRKRRVDGCDASNAHERPKAKHPLGSPMTADLRYVCGTPVRHFGLAPMGFRFEHLGSAANDVLIAHLHRDDGVRVWRASRVDPEGSFSFKKAGEPHPVAVFAAMRERKSKVLSWRIKRHKW
jgi:hypothetical protein